MSTNPNTLGALAQSIQSALSVPYAEQDAVDAARNLAGFFEVLLAGHIKQRGNEHENHRSADHICEAK